MINIIFIAPPCSGKGTISKYLVDNYGYRHISTGDLLREVVNKDNELSHEISSLMKEGKLISDDIIFELLDNELKELSGKSFILDGIPRNINQAKRLNEINVNNYVVINIEVNKDLLIKRATGRRLCSKCKSSYNIYFEEFKPKVDGICNVCGSNLIKRVDDTEETFKTRYQSYLNSTLPILNYYKDKELLKSVDGNQTNDKIIADVITILNQQ